MSSYIKETKGVIRLVTTEAQYAPKFPTEGVWLNIEYVPAGDGRLHYGCGHYIPGATGLKKVFVRPSTEEADRPKWVEEGTSSKCTLTLTCRLTYDRATGELSIVTPGADPGQMPISKDATEPTPSE